MKTMGKVIKPENSKTEKVQFPAFARPPITQQKLPLQDAESQSTIVTDSVPQKDLQPPQKQESTASHNDGFRSGYKEGMQKAQEDGFKQGFTKGQEEGFQQGHSEGLQKGMEEGHLQGAEKGYEQGFAHGKQDLDYLKQQMDSQLDQVSQLKHEHREQLSHWLSEVIHTVVEHVTRIELRNRPEHIYRVIEDTLQQLPTHSGYFKVHLNPVDAEKLVQLHPDIRERWSIVAAPEVAPGDCYVEAEHSEAEASLEQRMSDCLNLIRQELPKELEKHLS
ncbi:FliH/SctL family protein [Parendozoicomonas sp. Alg238-R29]|uniref:FliH/SctL family protein n=1 Tax=Parendozoicomonas sp. Alg238-R29 TaxID=2993446 RepID=UPI00248EAE22|nr:FliH/SctL family protein [Parendozoicomonas sp. Alg238-R29]